METTTRRLRPAAYAEPGRWPDGPLKSNAPPEAHLAAALAIRLREALGTRPLEPFAGRCGISSQTIRNALQGNAWPDLRTIARLEVALGKRLWGKEHREAAEWRKAADQND